VTLTTTMRNDLLVAGNYVQTSTTAAGAGYTNRVITAPDGNILEDRTCDGGGRLQCDGLTERKWRLGDCSWCGVARRPLGAGRRRAAWPRAGWNGGRGGAAQIGRFGGGGDGFRPATTSGAAALIISVIDAAGRQPLPRQVPTSLLATRDRRSTPARVGRLRAGTPAASARGNASTISAQPSRHFRSVRAVAL